MKSQSEQLQELQTAKPGRVGTKAEEEIKAAGRAKNKKALEAIHRLQKLAASARGFCRLVDMLIDELGGLQKTAKLIAREIERSPEASHIRARYVQDLIGMLKIDAQLRGGNVDEMDGLEPEDLAAVAGLVLSQEMQPEPQEVASG